MPDTSARDATQRQLRELLHRSPLPLAVVDLTSQHIVDANDASLSVLGDVDRHAFPLSLAEVLVPEDEALASRALQLVAEGTIQSYDARRHVRRRGGGSVPGHIWVRPLRIPEVEVALVVFLPEEEDADGSETGDDVGAVGATPVALPGAVVVGSMDAATRVTQVSADARILLRIPAGDLLGKPFVDFVHADDIGTLLAALGNAVTADAGLAVRIRVRRGDGSYVPVRALVTPMRREGDARFGFVLTSEAPPPPTGDRSTERIAELEQHLWRIAAEVQAAGVVDNLHRLPDHTELPGLAQLSTRQWQVLSGLLRGERVADIARSMFVSQSTVRNHLANIFRTLGVHSQAELLALLRERAQRGNGETSST